MRLWVYNLPASRATSTRSCASPRRRWSASAGTFRVDAKGNAYVILTTAAKRGQYDSIRVVRKSDGHEYNVLDGKLA